ncbi:hypothetical protein THAOC_28123, partial [Thalassiosira oceanica]
MSSRSVRLGVHVVAGMSRSVRRCGYVAVLCRGCHVPEPSRLCRAGTSSSGKQPRADAPFDRADDDNGPGSAPPPQDRIVLFMAVMPSPRRPPAAVGKPSFPYFKADYLPIPDDVCRPRRPTIFRHRISATRWRTKDPKAWAQTAGIRRVVPSNPRRRRRIPSISSCCRNNFGRESDHST